MEGNGNVESRILIIQTCGVTGEREECVSIKNQMDLYGIVVDEIQPKTNKYCISEFGVDTGRECH